MFNLYTNGRRSTRTVIPSIPQTQEIETQTDVEPVGEKITPEEIKKLAQKSDAERNDIDRFTEKIDDGQINYVICSYSINGVKQFLVFFENYDFEMISTYETANKVHLMMFCRKRWCDMILNGCPEEGPAAEDTSSEDQKPALTNPPKRNGKEKLNNETRLKGTALTDVRTQSAKQLNTDA